MRMVRLSSRGRCGIIMERCTSVSAMRDEMRCAVYCADMSWVIVGLGNPGEEYQDTRHNAGRIALQSFAREHGSPEWKKHSRSKSLTTGTHMGKEMIALVLPDTFMNRSGAAVAAFVKGAKAAERLIVVYDDLDLPLGKIKISFDRGSGGHKGVESIAAALKTKRFARIRIGISPSTASGETKKPVGDDEVEKFVLGSFRSAEREELARVSVRVGQAIEDIITKGPEVAMNTHNA